MIKLGVTVIAIVLVFWTVMVVVALSHGDHPVERSEPYRELRWNK